MSGPSHVAADGPLRVLVLPGEELATAAVATIRDQLAAGADPTDIAVLARVNSALLPVQVALGEAGLTHTAPLDTGVLARTGVRAALAYLRLGLAPDRIARSDVLDTVNRPPRKVRSAVQPLLARRATWTLAQLRQLVPSLDPSHQDRFRGYLDDLTALRDLVADGADTAACLAYIRTGIGLDDAIDVLDRSRTRPEGSSHGDDLDALRQLAGLHPDPHSFAGWLRDALQAPADPAGITLSTVHRVKGMEWPHVLVAAANQGLFPHRLADDLEEERRVFHVALTRCRETVTVLCDVQRPSGFLAELTAPAPARPPRLAPPPVADAAVVVRADGTVAPPIGAALTVAGGFQGIVTAHEPGHAVLRLDAGTGPIELRVAHGEPVQVGEQPARLAPPPRVTGTGRGPGATDPTGAGRGRRDRAPGRADDGIPEDVDPALFERLRSWRARAAAEAGVPAFLVFHDRTLLVLASERPQDLAGLAACRGVGPAKLERYGDDLLDLLAEETGPPDR